MHSGGTARAETKVCPSSSSVAARLQSGRVFLVEVSKLLKLLVAFQMYQRSRRLFARWDLTSCGRYVFIPHTLIQMFTKTRRRIQSDASTHFMLFTFRKAARNRALTRRDWSVIESKAKDLLSPCEYKRR